MGLVFVHALFSSAAGNQGVRCLIPVHDGRRVLIVLFGYLVRLVHDCDLAGVDDGLSDKPAELFPHRAGDNIIHAVDSDDVGKNIGDRPDLVDGFVVMSSESKCVAEVVAADADVQYPVFDLIEPVF